MLAAARREIPRTNKFLAFASPLRLALRGSDADTSVETWLNPAIVEQHSFLTFQKADKIADAIRLVTIVDEGLWPLVATAMGVSDVRALKDRLDLIIDRRNAIAHEDDADLAGGRSPIDLALVIAALDDLAAIVAAIDDCMEE